jgi:glycosyltransferase involved in cell wall biosynthesis
LIAEPLVSVIIPVYNCERYVEEAICSVLNQTYKPLELILVDDGSTDDSAKIIKKYEPDVHYLSQSNQGMAAARNRGIEAAGGDYFAFLDADDLWVPDKIQAQITGFREVPSLDLISGYVQQFYSPELDADLMQNVRCPDEPLAAHVAGAMLVKRESFFRVGFFETVWQVGTDMSWHLRAREAGLQMKILPSVVLKRRLHRNNRGLTHRHLMGQRLRILKQSLDRRRAK